MILQQQIFYMIFVQLFLAIARLEPLKENYHRERLPLGLTVIVFMMQFAKKIMVPKLDKDWTTLPAFTAKSEKSTRHADRTFSI